MGDGGGGGGGSAIGLAVVLVRALGLLLHFKRQVVGLEILGCVGTSRKNMSVWRREACIRGGGWGTEVVEVAGMP